MERFVKAEDTNEAGRPTSVLARGNCPPPLSVTEEKDEEQRENLLVESVAVRARLNIMCPVQPGSWRCNQRPRPRPTLRKRENLHTFFYS